MIAILSRIPKLAFLIAAVVLVLGTATGGSLYWIGQQKQALKDATNQEVKHFSSLQEKYALIVDTLKKQNQPIEKSEANLLLSYPLVTEPEKPYSNLEDSIVIQTNRALTQHYRDAKSIVADIDTANQKVTNLTQAFPGKIFLPQPGSLTEDTGKFVTDSSQLLAYLEQVNQLQLEAVNLGVEIGLAMQEVGARNVDKQSLENLEAKINQVDAIRQKYTTIEVANFSSYVQDLHTKDLEGIDKNKQIFQDIHSSLKNLNVYKFFNAIESLAIQSVATSQTSLVDTITFWQNDPTIQSVNSLHSRWQDYQETL